MGDTREESSTCRDDVWLMRVRCCSLAGNKTAKSEPCRREKGENGLEAHDIGLNRIYGR